MQPWDTAKMRLVGTAGHKIKAGGEERAYRRMAGQFHLAVQVLLTPGAGFYRRAKEIFHICSSTLL